MTEATPEQIASSGAAAGSWGLDPIDGDARWTPAGGHTREVPEFTLEKSRANSVAAYRVNPLGRAIIDTYVAFCVGDVGVSYQCSNPDVTEIVKEFWEDPHNDLSNQQEILLRDMLIMGETCLELDEGAVSGVMRFKPVMVGDITRMSLINRDYMHPDQLFFENAGAQRRAPLTVVRINDETGLREGDAVYWRPWRTLTSDLHSVPFLTPVLDWLDSYDTVLSNLIDRTSLARYLVWDVTVQGGQDAVDNFIQARGGTSIPRSGTVEVHNESVQWEPKTVTTGAQEDSIANQSVMTLVAGGTGLSKTWLAEPEGANRATSMTMAEPVRRRVQSVQRVWLGYMQELLRLVVDRAVDAGRLPREVVSVDSKTGQEYKVAASQSVTVVGPEIAAADTQITAQVLLNLSTGLQNLVGSGALSREAAHVAAKKAWEDYTGVTYTQDLDDPTKGMNAQPPPAPPGQEPGNGGGGGGGGNSGGPPASRPPGSNGANVKGDNTGKGKGAAGVNEAVPFGEAALWELVGDIAEIRDALDEAGDSDPIVEAAWAAIELADPYLVVSAWESVAAWESDGGDWNPDVHPRGHDGKFAKKPGGGFSANLNKFGVDLNGIKVGDQIVDKKGNTHTVEKTQGTKYFKTNDGNPAWVGGATITAHKTSAGPTSAAPPPLTHFDPPKFDQPKVKAPPPAAHAGMVNKHGVDVSQIKPGDTINDSNGKPHTVAAVQGKKNLVFKTEDGSPAWVSSTGVKDHQSSDGQLGSDEQQLLDKIMGSKTGTSIKNKPKKVTPSAPAAALPADAFDPVDTTGWKQVGSQLGSNKGALYEAPDGNRYYLKVGKSEDHVRNELVANELYKAAGVKVVDLHAAHTPDGKLATISPWEPNAKMDLATQANGGGAYMGKLQDGFAVDAWLGNWDVAGLSFDNVANVNGEPVRMDQGGALLFRAQGAPKGASFGDKALEWNTLRDPGLNPHASKVFGNMTAQQRVDSAKHVAQVSSAQIDDIVYRAGFDPATSQKLRTRLHARQTSILDQAAKDFGDTKSKPKVSSVGLQNGTNTYKSHPMAKTADIEVSSIGDVSKNGKFIGTITKNPDGVYIAHHMENKAGLKTTKHGTEQSAATSLAASAAKPVKSTKPTVNAPIKSKTAAVMDKVLAVDTEGNDMHLGDKVSFSGTPGEIVGYNSAKNVIKVKFDGKGNVAMDVAPAYLHKITPPKVKPFSGPKEPIGHDIDGKTLHLGDKVDYYGETATIVAETPNGVEIKYDDPGMFGPSSKVSLNDLTKLEAPTVGNDASGTSLHVGDKITLFGDPGTITGTSAFDSIKITLDNGHSLVAHPSNLHKTGDGSPKLGTPPDISNMSTVTSSAGNPMLVGHDAYGHVPKSSELFTPHSPEAYAIAKYTGSWYKDINDGLRNGDKPHSAVAALDNAFTAAPATTHEIRVSRGVEQGSKLFGPVGSKVGKTFSDKAYISTSHGPGFMSSTKIEIEIPAGAHVLKPNGLGSFGDSEGEILLNRGSKFMIIEDVMGSDGKRHLKMRLVVE